MLMLEDKKFTMTTLSGAASQAVNGAKGRRLVQIFIKPKTATTVYDFSITDKNSETIYSFTDWTGTYIDTENMPQFVYGNFTMALANATNDEAFTVILVFSEEAF